MLNGLTCELCGGQIEVYSDRKTGRCVKCGTKVIINKDKYKRCENCNHLILKEALVCTNCGKEVENKNIKVKRKMKEKWIMFFLCLFGGIFGLHKFYKGQILWGIIYFFTLGIFLLGWAFDLIYILFSGYKR